MSDLRSSTTNCAFRGLLAYILNPPGGIPRTGWPMRGKDYTSSRECVYAGAGRVVQSNGAVAKAVAMDDLAHARKHTLD